MDSQAEKRARLRRAKILTNSEDRMNRIFGVQSSQSSSSSTTTNRDNNSSQDLPSSSNTFEAHRSECSSSRQQNSEQSSSSTATDSIQSQTHGTLPPRDESFPRKVSLISSPIHYKTLQQSQRFQQQQNSMLSMIFIWPSSLNLLNPKLLLFVISCIGSYYGVNFMTLFFTFASIHFIFGCLMNNNNNNNNSFNNPNGGGNINNQKIVCVF
ncbi:hypothetical protein BLA29_008097 [Euroglyphus maynei]|uniref:Uncharacterized protein n=1 Tax=Euroglyphus maynei TaxID=6958 RepID=A0A1Y3AL29_EURMA|nr:hypothetical protein BLA29_008097 [Euroglyphus maynei]